MRLYLEAAPLIYLVEQVPPFAAQIRERLAQLDTRGVSSELSLLECRIKPLREGDQALLEDFDGFFAGGLIELIPISAAVLETATELRAHYRFLKTPDAIHLASASLSGCEIFLTHDRALERCQRARDRSAGGVKGSFPVRCQNLTRQRWC